jgi:hypothetical protein
MARRISSIGGHQALRDCQEMAVGLALPLPVTRRLDILVGRAEEEGGRAYRKDLVGALILFAPESATELDDLVRRYRKAQARDALVAGEPAAVVLDATRPRPGRRAKN